MIKDVAKEVEEITKWIKKYVEEANAKGVVVGNSGGKDSAVVIALAKKALGKENILAITMPCNSIQTDIEDAKLVAETFNTTYVEIDLENTFQMLEDEIKKVIESKENGEQKEAQINTKPRLRMATLYYLAQTQNYLVIGTGNKCEQLVGYTTKWGDNAHDFNPIGDFTVEEVLQIGEYLGVPKKILEKAPSDGLGSITDEDKLGVTYKQIAEYIETGKTDPKAMEIIKQKEKASEHKRNKIPVYKRLEDNGA